MTSALTGSNGRMVPEYTTAQVQTWLGDQVKAIDTLTGTLLIGAGLIGFILFALGVIAVMRSAREQAAMPMGGAGGGSSKGGVTLMVVGALFGAADLVALLVIGIIRPGP